MNLLFKIWIGHFFGHVLEPPREHHQGSQARGSFTGVTDRPSLTTCTRSLVSETNNTHGRDRTENLLKIIPRTVSIMNCWNNISNHLSPLWNLYHLLWFPFKCRWLELCKCIMIISRRSLLFENLFSGIPPFPFRTHALSLMRSLIHPCPTSRRCCPTSRSSKCCV